MKLVLLFFCVILSFILFFLLILIFSTIKLNIKEIKISNYENGFKKKLEKKINIFLEVYLFGIIKIGKINLNKKIFNKMKTKFDFKKISKNAKKIEQIKILKLLNLLRIRIEEANLNAQIGTEGLILTVFAVTFLSSISRHHT